MNVPSSLAMIRIAYQDPVEQNHAYAWYASAGAIGNVLGFIIGGVLTARTTWRWGTLIISPMYDLRGSYCCLTRVHQSTI